MTSLSNKLIRNFLAGIMACILLFSISMTILLKANSKTFYEDTRDKRSEVVKEKTFKYLVNNDTKSLTRFLENISAKEDMDIDLLDNDGKTILSYKGLDADENSPLKTDEYKILGNNDISIAELQVKYYDRSNIYMLERLHKNMANGIIISLIISLPIVFIIARILSVNLTEPIKEIGRATEMIREGQYEVDFKDTNIRELDHLQESIQYLAKNLQNQVYIRKQYAQDISHELRTPITNLKLYIEALRDGMIEASKETMNLVLEEVDRLNSLVENLKKTFDQNTEYIAIKRKRFNLSDQLERLLDSFLGQAISKKIEIKRDIPKNVYINSDLDKINHIVQNLLANAIKAIGRDGVIEVFLEDLEDRVKIYVRDSGIGIEEEKIPLIFERFYRIDDARNTKENGHGLGLAISKNFIQALGGKIEVESKVGEGSTFIVTLYK